LHVLNLLKMPVLRKGDRVLYKKISVSEEGMNYASGVVAPSAAWDADNCVLYFENISPAHDHAAITSWFEDVGEVAGVNVEYAGVCPRCRRRKLGLPDAAHVESSPSTGE
ncbi:hypothetical protein HOI71_22080, partial [Candidatus Poribacteria bacterium]|nr:hypothetical protein [Candidatus Poribacteria bacterium]